MNLRRKISLIIFSLCLAPAVSAKTTLSLREFIDQVRSQSPDLVAEKANIEAAGARAEGIRLTPPMIGVMQMKDQGATNQGYEVSQEIPFPTKIGRERRARDLELQVIKENSSSQVSLVFADARLAYVAFWSARERLELLREKHDWLKHHTKLTGTLSWSDTAAKIHLLETESEADLVENEVIALESELTEKRNTLRVYAPKLEVEGVVPVEPPILTLQAQTEESSLIKAKEKELEAKDALVGLKKQSYLPDFFVRVRSFNGNEMSASSQEVMIGITVPFLFYWQPKAEIAEALAQRSKAEAELHKARVEFSAKVSSLLKKAESLEAQIKNLKTKLIPRAERQLKLVRNLSQRTMEGLDQHRMVMISSLELKSKAVALRLEHEEALRELVKITGNFSEGSSK